MMAKQLSFQKAVRYGSRARVALIGPTGAGKTLTGLMLACGLGERVAVVDTEHGSASKYVGDELLDGRAFDVLELDTFGPPTYVQAIEAAEGAGYDVLLVDSLSHAWTGKDGALEMVDRAAKRHQGNNFAGWRDVTPQHNAMVEALVGAGLHLVCTLRSKMEYVLEEGKGGRKSVRKVGMQPVQRDGLEYEFDLIADMDVDHNLIVGKTRCRAMDGLVVQNPTAAAFGPYVGWLAGEERPEPAAEAPEAGAAKATDMSPEQQQRFRARLFDLQEQVGEEAFARLVREWDGRGLTPQQLVQLTSTETARQAFESLTTAVEEMVEATAAGREAAA